MNKTNTETTLRTSDASRPSSASTLRKHSLVSVDPLPRSLAQARELINSLQRQQAELETQNETQRQSALDLKRSLDRSRQLYDSAPTGLVTLDANGMIVEANLSAEELFGVDRARLIRQPLARFFAPDEARRYETFLESLLASSDRQTAVLRVRRAEGVILDASFEGITVKAKGARLRVHLVIKEPPAIDRFGGTSRKELENRIEEQAERIRLLERQRDELDKLALAGRMAAAIMQEINNPLAGVIYSFMLVKKAIPVDHPDFRFVERVEEELNRMAGIIRQMHQMNRPSTTGNSVGDVQAAMDDVLQILKVSVRAKEITMRLAEHQRSVAVQMPEHELKQVLYNLILNAVQASPQRGHIALAVTGRKHKVSIEVTDQGKGISPDKLPHIFEPFHGEVHYADDDQGSGLGLGLSVSRALVHAAGGAIDVRTEPGKGSVFTLILPRVKTETGNAPRR